MFGRQSFTSPKVTVLLLIMMLVTPAVAGVKNSYDNAGRLIRADYGNGVVINYSYDKNGNLVSEAASNPVAFSFPFNRGDASSYTGFAVSNFSARTAGLNFTALGPSGTPLSFPSNPRALTLDPKKQLARLSFELFGLDSSTAQNGWIKMTTDNPDIGSFFLTGSGQQLDGSVAFTQQSKTLYFTRVFEGSSAFRGQPATTLLNIANPNDAAITVKLNLIGPQTNQTLAPDQTRNIPAKGIVQGSVSEIFGRSLSVSSAYIRVDVTQGDGAVGFQLIQLPSRDTVIGLNASFGNGANQSYAAQLASASGIFTDLKLVNVGSQPRTVTLTAVAEDGSDLAAPKQINLAPGGAFEQDAGPVFNFAAGAVSVGSLRAQADGPGVIGDVIFGDPTSFSYAAALPLQSQTFTKAVFSHVANTDAFFTGLALYNPGNASATVTIEVFSAEGALAGSTSLSLGGGRRLSELLQELIPTVASQLGGYIVIRSTQPLIAQQLFGTFNLSLLSAVPPTIVH